MTRAAFRCCRNVIGCFASSRRPVVASAAIGQVGVIDLCASPSGGGLVATLATGIC